MTDGACPTCGRPDRRTTLGGLLTAGAGLAASPAFARAALTQPRAEDAGFMRLALAEAAQGDFPFGAVIVKDGQLRASGRNSGKRLNDPTAHGEMMAIRAFIAAHPAEEMKNATLYTTGESCAMCMGAIIWCGFGRVVYGASIEELSRSHRPDHDRRQDHRRRHALHDCRDHRRRSREGGAGAVH